MIELTTQDIRLAGRLLPVPFCLAGRSGTGRCRITIEKVLRILPGKRLVARATTEDGVNILIKLYLGRSAKRYALREVRGTTLIHNASIPTPRLLWQGETDTNTGNLLAFEFLEDAVSLQTDWQHTMSRSDHLEILREAMSMLAQMHARGVIQRDIHLGNFLRAGNQLYMIDGGHVERHRYGPLSIGDSIANLAEFFAQFFPRYDSLIPLVFPEYLKARSRQARESELARLDSALSRCREVRKRGYLRKTLRDCTQFECETTFRRFLVCVRDSLNRDIMELLDRPDYWMDRGEALKRGGSATIVRVQLGHHDLVVKRYNLKGPLHRLKRALGPSRARRSWVNAWRMEFLGIPSVKPIAMIEEKLGPFRGRAYFVSEYVAGRDALATIKTSQQPDDQMAAISSLLQDLSDSRISHGDMKATNFMMSATGPVIMDLDAMREHRDAISFRRAFRRDLKRFMENWRDRPELANQFRGLLADLDA